MSDEPKRKQQERTSRRTFLLCILMIIAAYFLIRTATKTSNNQNVTNTDVLVGNENGNTAPKATNESITQGTDTVYSNTEYGWKIQTTDKPPLQIKEGDITTVEFAGGKVSIMLNEQEWMIRNSISNVKEEEVTVSGYKAKKLQGSSLKDGSPTTMILLIKDDQLYVFTGSDVFLNERVIGSFIFFK